jgi:hypothetical protein
MPTVRYCARAGATSEAFRNIKKHSRPIRVGAAYALNGEVERGAAELAEHYRLSGRVWVSTIADMKVTGYWGPPKIRKLFWTVYFAGLRKLGVPEE